MERDYRDGGANIKVIISPLKKSGEENCFRSENSLLNNEKWAKILIILAHFSLRSKVLLKEIFADNFFSVFISTRKIGLICKKKQ